MLTLLTGTPGAGKTLHAVWEICRKVPGSTLEATAPVTSHGVSYPKGAAVPRHLFTNIRGLLVDAQVIDADAMQRWPEWAQPGDVIVFDEVQEIWRPRAVGSKVPDCIAKLEVHRHMGVDLVLITQHPNLVDANVRRLVNQHLHLRRLTKTLAMLYEWDHCSDPGRHSTALQSRMWWHPKAGYALYSSSQLHTKPTARLPRLALVGLVAVVLCVYLVPTVYGRVSERFTVAPPASKAAPATPAAALAVRPASSPASAPGVQVHDGLEGPPSSAKRPAELAAGCAWFRKRCGCIDGTGKVSPAPLDVCMVAIGTEPPLKLWQEPGGPPVASAADLETLADLSKGRR
jgi:zona occludens toxin